MHLIDLDLHTHPTGGFIGDFVALFATLALSWADFETWVHTATVYIICITAVIRLIMLLYYGKKKK
jgi:hypothetical protein